MAAISCPTPAPRCCRSWPIAPLLAQQLVGVGEAVLDVQPKLGAPGAAVGGWELEQERPQPRPLSGYSSAALDNPARWLPKTTPPPQG
jgi:hypothetical protein